MHWRETDMKKRLTDTEAHSPGIQIVTHTVQDNGTVHKKLKFPSTCSILSMQGSQEKHVSTKVNLLVQQMPGVADV